ncbi:MAG: DUF4623 domain-containing protein [Phycisphaerales bacterium]|nr:DUF4623 domain-containing protein [Phycisphaerales bacterium]
MRRLLLSTAAALVAPAALAGTPTLSPMTSWGFNGDGWWAPGENGITYLTTTNEQRSMAVNPANGNVYLTNGLSVRILDPLTGAASGLLDTTGISGGARSLNTVGVTRTGQIYGANLTTNSTTSPYKIYHWASEAAAPSNVYSGDASLPGSRIGDDIDVWGDLLAAGYSNNPVVAGNNGFAVLDTNTNTLTRPAFPGTPPNAGDFRLSIAGVDGDTLYGTQSSGGTGRLRVADFSGGVATLVTSIQLTSASERGMDYAFLDGTALLATIDTVSSIVRLYDVTGVDGTTTSLAPIASLDLTAPDNANGNGTSAVAFGKLVNTGSERFWPLYAMNTNNGIQAFKVVVPEPASVTILAFAALFAMRRR